MKSDPSWYARHVGGQQQARQQQPQQYPTQVQQPQYPQYPQQQQYQPQQPQQFSPQQKVQIGIHDFVEAAAMWQGGEATRTETERCPKCGGDHYFSRAQGARRGPPPAPMCADCGFNGMFEQADQGVWGAA